MKLERYLGFFLIAFSIVLFVICACDEQNNTNIIVSEEQKENTLAEQMASECLALPDAEVVIIVKGEIYKTMTLKQWFELNRTKHCKHHR